MLSVERGSIVLVELDPTLGHEQRGVRPCVVISDPDAVAAQRFPLICVLPVTGTAGSGSLYPELSPSGSGLTKVSYAMVDQIRSIDKVRIRRVYRSVTPAEMFAINRALRLFLGL